MAITIDIKTRVFDEDDVAYRLFPGQGYRYFQAMKDNSIVFLDNPGLPLPGPTGYEKSPEMLEIIARSEEKQPFVYADDENLAAELSSLDNKDFSSSRWGKKRELNLSWLNGLYNQAQVGDLIVVPSPAIVRNTEGELERGATLIGEIVGEPERWTKESPRNLFLAKYVVRRVRWLAEINELELDPQVAIALRTQNAFISMRARSFERVLGATYKNVVMGDEFLARFVTENAEFTAFESFHFNAFVMAAVAACRTLENGGKWEQDASIYDIAARIGRDDTLVPEQEASIHSPGYMTIRGAILVPAVLSALFALALKANADPFAGVGLEQVTVVNSESTAFDPCDVGIDRAVREALNIMGYDRWQQACEAGRKSNDNDGLQSITSVTVTPDGQ